MNPPQLLKRMSPVPGIGARVTMQQLNGNVNAAPINTQSSQLRDESPPIGNASGHPQPVRPKNSQEIQEGTTNPSKISTILTKHDRTLDHKQ